MRFSLCKDKWGGFGPDRASIFCPLSRRTKTTEKDTEHIGNKYTNFKMIKQSIKNKCDVLLI